MSWTPGRWVGRGPNLSAPGALTRALVRLGALALPVAAIVALVAVWPESPPAPQKAPTVNLSSSPSSFPETPANSETTPVEQARETTPVERTHEDVERGEEPPPPEERSEPQEVRESVHEHVYEFDFRGTLLAILAAIAAAALVLRFAPINPYTAVAFAAACSLALWLGIEVVYAGQFPVVFDSRDDFFEDGVRHIVTNYDHSHPVIVRVPLVILAAGFGARSLWGTWHLYRASRRRAMRRSLSPPAPRAS
jgi:hypothetical protein